MRMRSLLVVAELIGTLVAVVELGNVEQRVVSTEFSVGS
jgi:hypothetical protein